MKLYEIQHINENHNPNKVMGMELKFTHSICSTSGKLYEAGKQPKDWKHVKRLTHMLFLAWNDDNPIEGVVYLGELYTPQKTDEEKFYEFFEKFNSFPINNAQKAMYDIIKNGGYTASTRQSGSTVLLLTMAAWEAYTNRNHVIYFAHSYDTCDLYQIEYNKKWRNLGTHLPNRTTFRYVGTDMTQLFRGYSSVRVFFDNNYYYNRWYGYYHNIKYHNLTKLIHDIKEYGIDTF